MFLRRRAQQEDGFTLVELLVAIVLSGIVMGGITTGFVAALGSTKGVHDRFIESHDAQLLSTTFISDVQSADPTKTDFSASPAGGCGTGTNVVQLQWTETTTTTTTFTASYRTPIPPDGTLVRYFCSTGNPDSSRVVAHSLSTTSLPTALLDGSTVKMTLHSKSGDPYTFTSAVRTPGAEKFIVTASGSPAAGVPVTLTLKASSDGVNTDPNYIGAKTLGFSGPTSSSGGNSPVYPTGSVTFFAGQATVDITLYNAGTSTLLVTEGSRQGSLSLTVAAAVVPLNFSSCPPTTSTNTVTAMNVVRGTDVYGNADPNAGTAIPISLTTTGGSFTPASLSITAGSTQTSSSSSYKTPLSSGTSVTLTAKTTATGYTDATCTFTTTGSTVNPVFIVGPIGNQVAGTSFDVTIKASSDGTTTDTSYTGTKTLVFSGPSNSPNGTAPLYPTTVSFTNGVGTATGIKLYKAATSTLTVTEATRTGSTSVTVSAAPVQLNFSACPNVTKGTATSGISVSRAATDTYGNSDATGPSAVTVSLTVSGGGSWSRTSLTINANSLTSSSTATYTTPNGNNQAVTVTASATGYTSATCSFTTTN